MKPISNMRRAYASRGDDTTLTRWIKEPQRHAKPPATTPMPETATRTRFVSRVLRVEDMASLLVSGHSNVKIGRDVRKGKFKGYWIYTLSLEERATCPRSCRHWTTCYGNSMPFGKRIDHTDPAFLPALEAEIARLVKVRGRKGVLIRLHALGDFYSAEYVRWWWGQLGKHPTLAVFGYTARLPGTEIGDALSHPPSHLSSRWWMRRSDGGARLMSTVSIKRGDSRPANAFLCPEQTGQTLACATCAACWSTTKNVAFTDH